MNAPVRSADEVLLGFTRALRAAGVAVTQDRAHGFLTAVAEVGLDDRQATYWAGRATLCGSPDEIVEKLIELEMIQKCAVRQFYRYSIGRRPVPIEDQPIDALFAAFEASGFKFDQLVLDFVASEAFALKKEVP